MKKHYFLTPDATKDILDIDVYTYEEWGQQQMIDYHNDLLFVFESLANCQNLITPDYVVCINPKLEDWDHRFIRYKYHIIFFRWIDEGVSIVRVLHNRADFLSKIIE